MALGRPVLTRLLVPKTMCENGEKSSAPSANRQHADGFRKQGPKSKFLPMLLFAMDYRASQTEVTGTKFSC